MKKRIENRQAWDEEKAFDPWFNAVLSAESGVGIAAVIKVLRGSEPLTETGREALAAALERWEIDIPKGLSDEDLSLLSAALELREVLSPKRAAELASERATTVEQVRGDVIDWVAKRHGVTKAALRGFVAEKSRAYRELKPVYKQLKNKPTR